MVNNNFKKVDITAFSFGFLNLRKLKETFGFLGFTKNTFEVFKKKPNIILKFFTFFIKKRVIKFKDFPSYRQHFIVNQSIYCCGMACGYR